MKDLDSYMLSSAVCDVMAKPHCYPIRPILDQSDNNEYDLFTVGLAYPRLLIVDNVLQLPVQY